MVSGFNGDGDCAQTASWLDRKSEGGQLRQRRGKLFHCEPGNEKVSYGGTKEFYTRKGLLWALCPDRRTKTRVSAC